MIESTPRSMAIALAIVLVTVTGLTHHTALGEPRHGEFPNETIDVDGTERAYRLVVPRAVDLTEPAPLVLAYHGFLVDSKDVMPRYTKLNAAAAKHKFILAYPNGLDRSWALNVRRARQDIAFFDALVAKLSKDYEVNANRIYVLGMSNGGYFAHLLGQVRSTKIAAVAGHSSALGVQTVAGINAERKFPVMIAHGVKDHLIKIDLARANRDLYKKEGHEVNYVEIKNLGHFWGTKVKINDQIWKFFEAHPLNADIAEGQ